MFIKGFVVLVFTLVGALAQKDHYQATSYSTYTSHDAPSASIPHPIPAPIIKHAPVYSFPSVTHSSHAEPSHHIDYYAEPKYEYKYGVEDSHTGDKKSQSEQRDGDHTAGEYSLVEPDGTVLTVKYQVIGKSGFVADVQRSGHAGHPQIVAYKSH